MKLEELKVGDPVAVRKGGYGRNDIARSTVTRVTATIIRVEGVDAAFSRRTGNVFGSNHWNRTWITVWDTQCDEQLADAVLLKRTKHLVNDMYGINWNTLSLEQLEQAVAAMEAIGILNPKGK